MSRLPEYSYPPNALRSSNRSHHSLRLPVPTLTNGHMLMRYCVSVASRSAPGAPALSAAVMFGVYVSIQTSVSESGRGDELSAGQEASSSVSLP